ncbi:MAG: class I SAM-dependent methyltransferase [Saprospiraceae bacterium]|nr:class I SAM-dependent methyltransferase [Saprospiraceae bacterium]
MRAPKWKIWLSYLAEIHLESASSEYNPHLYVSLRKGRYQLSTAHAIYSYSDLYSNFTKAFQQIDLDCLKGNTVLVLGFGLGSIPVILEQQKNYHYTIVEIDEVVLDLANRYILDEVNWNMELICADAYAFLLQTEATFDMICMDIFLDDEVPVKFESIAFLEALRDALNPGGILLFNRLAANKTDVQRTETFFHNQFSSIFPKGTHLNVGGNWILISNKDILKSGLH